MAEKTGFDQQVDYEKDAVRAHSTISMKEEVMEIAYDGENKEHQETFWDAVKGNPMACMWAFIFCFTIVSYRETFLFATSGIMTNKDGQQVMESFDMFLNGNFVALAPFKERYGVKIADGTFAIPTKWQSALFQSGQCGAFIGVFLAGPITNRIGYRWTTILGLVMMNATIFISFFVSINSDSKQ